MNISRLPLRGIAFTAFVVLMAGCGGAAPTVTPQPTMQAATAAVPAAVATATKRAVPEHRIGDPRLAVTAPGDLGFAA